jgi:putative membrane protein (TIGR04086 family)
MSQEKRFSGEPVLLGCLVSCVCMVVLLLPISLVLTNWLGVISSETEQVVQLFIWLIAVGLGGYYAARHGKPTGWINSLAVGVLAELYVFAPLLDGKPGRGGLVGSLLDIINDPGAHWRRLLLLGLTIPVAILGGVIWEKTRGVQSATQEQAEEVRKAVRPGE